MKISLNEFEQNIDETILKRGLQYFKNGYVSYMEEVGGGEYEATVEGTETYTVNLTVKRNILTEYACDCPYDMGPMCKHVVAALFHLQKDVLNPVTTPVTKAKTTKKNSQPPQTVYEKIECVLGALSHEELADYVRCMCKKDKEFRSLFLSKYMYLISPVSKEFYSKQVRKLVNIYSERYGFVDYEDAISLGKALLEILEGAKTGFEKKEYRTAMLISFSVVEEIAEVLEMSDDSYGYIGDCMGSAINLIAALTEAKIDESLRKDLFDALLFSYEGNKLNGWDWHFSIMHFAINLVKTTQEKKRIENILEKIKPSGYRHDLEYQKAQELTLALIRKTGTEEDAVHYMSENLSNPDFRGNLIKRAINEENYETAKKLADDGLVEDEEEFSGLADKWRNYQLDVYQKTCDTKKILSLARYLIIHSDVRPLKHYYSILNSSVPADLWHDYLEGIISDLSKKRKWVYYDRAFELYVLEEAWDKLMNLLQENADFRRISDAEKYLGELYCEQLASLYQECILVFLKNNVGRPYYKEACRYIRRMMKLGSGDMAKQLIQKLKTLYPARRALREELDMI